MLGWTVGRYCTEKEVEDMQYRLIGKTDEKKGEKSEGRVGRNGRLEPSSPTMTSENSSERLRRLRERRGENVYEMSRWRASADSVDAHVDSTEFGQWEVCGAQRK